jgi:hypothetical protein
MRLFSEIPTTVPCELLQKGKELFKPGSEPRSVWTPFCQVIAWFTKQSGGCRQFGK